MCSSETTSKYFRLNFALYSTGLGPNVTDQNVVTIFLQLKKENNFFLYCVTFEIGMCFGQMLYSLWWSFCPQETLLFRVATHLTHNLISVSYDFAFSSTVTTVMFEKHFKIMHVLFST